LKKSHVVAIGATLLALGFAGFTGLSPASAEAVPYESATSADVAVNLGPLGDLQIPLSGGTFAGTVDLDTGAIDGGIDFPQTVSNVEVNGAPATVTTTIGLDGLTGTIAGDNTVTATGSFRINLIDLKTGDDAPIVLDPCNWSGDATLTGTYDPDTSTLVIAQAGFAFDASTDACGGLNALLTGYLTDDATDVTFTIELDAPVEPTTTTTVTTTVPASTSTTAGATTTTTAATTPAPAKAVAATAKYTG
jgi:hypothetical protein